MTDEAAEAAEAERRLGRSISLGLPPVAIGAAIVVGTVTSAGPAILVLIGGALLGGIALLWASLRTLGGDAPLAYEVEALAAAGSGKAALVERKQAALRALKDLELEHEIGKIDDADYATLQTKYREEAKDVLRELDLEIEPYREKAEALAQKHLAKVGLAETPNADALAPQAPPAAEALVCAKCGTKNDPDAAFCKKCGAALAGEASS